MEPPLISSLVLVILVSILAIYASLVEPQSTNEEDYKLISTSDISTPNIGPPPPLPSAPPPPPPSPPPPPPPLPPPPPPPPPPPLSPPPPPPPDSPHWPPPLVQNKPRHRRWRPPPPPPPPPPPKLNVGKKIGLLFAGIAAILQIGVVGFLVFKRRQLLKIKDRYENCSSN